MILVQGNEVYTAMEKYGRVLNRLRDHAVPSVEAGSAPDLTKITPPGGPPTTDVKDALPARPSDAAPRAPPPTASPGPPTSSPPGDSKSAAPPPEDLALLDKLKKLPLDQAERLMRRVRETPLPEGLLSELRTAHKELQDALDAEAKRRLEDVLRK
jgi:hypothetical protein